MTDKFKKQSNVYLAGVLLAVSLSNLKICLIDIGATAQYPILKYIPIIWPFLIPVLLYTFVQYLTHTKRPISSITSLMLIPFAINFIFQFLLLGIFFIKPSILESFSNGLSVLNQVKEFLAILFCLFMLRLIINHLKVYEDNLQDNYAVLTGRSLVWLSRLIKAILVLWFLWAIPYTILQITDRPLTHILYPFWIGLSVLIYWIGYSTFSRDDIFETLSFSDEIEEDIESPTNEISDAIESHYTRLKQLVSEEKIYLDPNLDMTLLAEKMNLSNGYLSQIINQKEGKNFFNFINGLRVEAVKEKLQNPEFSHYSVLGIALECGFNSKSTFNAVFKKLTGKTPSSFRK